MKLMNPEPSTGRPMVISVEKLQAGYGRKQVVFDADLHVAEGEIVSIVGANGAGKTTTLKTIYGRLADQTGLAVLVLEQNIAQALRVTDRFYVMRAGRIILEQTNAQMRARKDYWDLF
jgi:ABC-type branched-subunit amino acid transport system ATPase component